MTFLSDTDAQPLILLAREQMTVELWKNSMMILEDFSYIVISGIKKIDTPLKISSKLPAVFKRKPKVSDVNNNNVDSTVQDIEDTVKRVTK